MYAASQYYFHGVMIANTIGSANLRPPIRFLKSCSHRRYLLDLRRYPVPSSFESRITVDAWEADSQVDENECPSAEDDNHGNFDPLPYTPYAPYTTLLDLPALDADSPQAPRYVEELGEDQVQYGLYQAQSVSNPYVEQFQHHHHHPTVQISPEQPQPQPVAQQYTCPEFQKQFKLPCELK
ncbi:hypothetical protein BOTNAR_0346g00030 [Botryotinia narcissicola]|uniref:Uncharacterized protein n=1 Tax=Botryotinia narcissicola TaxID=278944 RepID=A0A4Z1HS41_9HELO|nr:hypothetical protein BOTNAR_0346g00030 [Botryotinia narcissicola]